MAGIQTAPSAQGVRPLLVGSSIPVLTYVTPEGSPFHCNAAIVCFTFWVRLPSIITAFTLFQSACSRGAWWA